MSTAVDAPAVIEVAALDSLIGELRARGHVVIGPTVRDGAVVDDEVRSLADLPVGWHDDQRPGSYRLTPSDDRSLFAYAVGPQSAVRSRLTPPRETIVTISRRGDSVEVTEPDAVEPTYAFLGTRACDVAAIRVQDRVLRDGATPDPGYARRRDAAFVVAVNCSTPAATCFCASMGTGPDVRGEVDLVLTELDDDRGHRFIIEAGTSSGREVLATLPREPAGSDDLEAARQVVEHARRSQTRQVDPEQARDVLAGSLEHPRWDDVASRCLSCANCTLVCPTCFCSAVENRTSLDGDTAIRERRWDSCFSLDHSWMHGSGPVRTDTRSRYRQWLTHKLSTWWDQFGSSGCVGCGRCIAWCPAGIDLTAEVAAFAAPEGVDP